MSAYEIRLPTPDDASDLIAYIKEVADEPDNGLGLNSAAEFTMTEAQERQFIQEVLDADNRLMLIAVTPERQIIASTTCMPADKRSGNRFTGVFGISVHRDWRNRGVGTVLTQEIIRWARQNSVVKRIELTVYANNARAIHVYEKLGFQHEGVKSQAVYKEGQFLDVMMMSIVFDKEIHAK